jgi:calcium-dependent protein kinase
MNMTEADASKMIKESDYSGSGQINYSEFIAATIDVKKFLSDTKLRSAFNLFDTDHSGKITVDNLHAAFQKLGQDVPMQEL